VIAQSTTNRVPIVWLRTVGKGKVIFWNTTLLSQKMYRGLLLQSFRAVQSYTVTGVANVAVMFLDDFPSPVVADCFDTINVEYNVTATDFYANHWYPDVTALASKFKFPYTTATMFNYNVRVMPPFDFTSWRSGSLTLSDGKTIELGTWLAHDSPVEWEIGFHGYNHLPLTVTNWSRSSGIDNMKLALLETQRRWEIDKLGPVPTTYVPPFNEYDTSGIRTVRDVWQTITVVAGLYYGSWELGQDREFGYEPWENRLYCIPRVTSGYVMDPLQKLYMLSQLSLFGTWTHVIHPGDKCEQIPYGGNYDYLLHSPWGLPWRGEPEKRGGYYEFERWLQFTKDYYPWLRFMTARDAVRELQQYDNTHIGYAVQNNYVTIQTDIAPAYVEFHVAHGTAIQSGSLRGGEILHSAPSDVGTGYILKVMEGTLTCTITARADSGTR
jgi:hypothetical protein